jgi:hypothetical protein
MRQRGVIPQEGPAVPETAAVTEPHFAYRLTVRKRTTPGDSGVCLTQTVSAVFSSSVTVRKLDWRPAARLCPALTKAKAEWDQRVIKHETQHVADVASVARAANRRWRGGKTFTECGPQPEAEATLRARIETALQAELRQMRDEAHCCACWFDNNTPPGAVVEGLDCELCCDDVKPRCGETCCQDGFVCTIGTDAGPSDEATSGPCVLDCKGLQPCGSGCCPHYEGTGEYSGARAYCSDGQCCVDALPVISRLCSAPQPPSGMPT